MNTQSIHETWETGSVPGCATLQEEPILTVLPVEPPAADLLVETQETSALGLVELLLKNPARLDRLHRDETKQSVLLTRFLMIALISYLLFAVAMIVILNTARAEAWPQHLVPVPDARWSNGSALGLALAYTCGLVGATCLCLPSFYFFGLLAGVRLSMLQIIAQVVRCKASSAVVLVGILPIYVAVVLGLAVFEAPDLVLEYCLYLGLVLPFVAGLEGMRAIYQGVMGMADTLPPERRCRRECFLRRLTLSWAACYSAVSPLLIYRLWEFLAGLFPGATV
jgi:hypothetical protein